MKKFIIDSIEDKKALCISLDGSEHFTVSREQLDEHAKEGCIIYESNDGFNTDLDATKKRAEYMKNKFDSLWQ